MSGGPAARLTITQADEARAPALLRLNPLAKLAAALVLIVALFVVRDPVVPLVSLVVAQLALLVGGPRGAGRAVAVVVIPVALVTVLSVTLGLWAAPDIAADSPVVAQLGPIALTVGGWRQGLATALRLVAIATLAYVGGATTNSGDFVRALIAQLRVPYRLGYAALASFRFVPRFRDELATIRRAHRARGVSFGRGPVGWVRRSLASVVPLIAGSIRHAERVALSMDARAFGYGETRTERDPVRWRTRDTVFVAAGVTVTIAIVLLAPPLVGPLVAPLVG